MGDLDDLNDWQAVAAETSLMDEVGRGRAGPPLRAWTIVYLLNLPVCVFFGLMTIRDGAGLGMILGLMTLYALGSWACVRSWPVGRAFVVGGGLVALAQFWPIAHIIAGVVGVTLARHATGQGPAPVDEGSVIGPAAGLIATLVTGGIVMLAAFAIGLFVRLVTPVDWWDGPILPGPKGKPIVDDFHDFL